MDLSHLSKETLICIINDLQDKVGTLQDKVGTLQDKVGTLQDKVGNTEQSTIYDIDAQGEWLSDEKIIPELGEGPLRYKKGTMYYHGMGPKEMGQKWYRESKDDAFGSMFEYRNKTKTFTHPKWEFHSGTHFCTNCSCCENNPRRGYIIHRCLGHKIDG